MKKTFPFLFTLIGLSILGILFIQITWLQGLFLLQKNQLVEKVNQAGVIVSSELGKKLNGGLAFHFPKKSLSLSGGGIPIVSKKPLCRICIPRRIWIKD